MYLNLNIQTMAAQTFSNCFMCCKKVEVKVDSTRYKVRKRICEQFLVLMSRYLNLNRGDDLNHYGSENTLDIKPGFRKKPNGNRKRKLFSCDHCLPLIESVCAIYKDWSVLQVKLNGSIKLMANLMQDESTSMAVTEDFEEAIDFRIRFIKQALNKLNSKDFPHLALKRLSTDSSPAYGKNFCDVVSEQENVAAISTAVTSGTICKVEPELVQEQEEEVAVDLDDADWQPNNDVEMDPLENDDDVDFYNEGDDNKKLKVSQKIKKPKEKIADSTDDGNNPFKCQICGKGFAQQRYQEKHEKRHTQPFKCRLCDRRFSLRINLRAHEKIHKEEKANQFQCGVCSRFFLKKADCTYHIRRVHEGNGDVLKDGVKWQPEQKSDNTKKNEQRKRTLKCQFCPRSFSRYVDKAKHERIHRKKSFKCPHCEMTFKRRCVLNTHLNRHSKPYQCGLCGTRFTQRNNCRNHQSRVHKVIDGVILKITEKPNEKDASRPPIKIETNLDGEGDPNTVSADKASESLKFTTKTDIQLSPIPDGNDNDVKADNANADSDSGSADIWQPGSDEEADDDDKNEGDSPGKDESYPVQAEEEKDDDDSKKQPRKFSNAEIARLRSKDPLPFKCEECGKDFALPSLVTAHVRLSHRKKIQRQCDTCGKEFRQLSSFKRHVNGKPSTCNKIISRLEAKNQNPNPESIIIETPTEVIKRPRMTKREMEAIRAQAADGDPLPFKCTECDRAYAVHAFLQRHRRSAHKIGVRFQCSICNNTFSGKYRLKQHMNSHTNTRPFKCRFCLEKSFNFDSRRTYHEQRCNSNPLKDQIDLKMHKCGICGQGFDFPVLLQRHVRAKHGLSEVPPPPPPPPLEPKEWICEKCGDVFLNQRVFYTHMLKEMRKDSEMAHRDRLSVGQSQ